LLGVLDGSRLAATTAATVSRREELMALSKETNGTLQLLIAVFGMVAFVGVIGTSRATCNRQDNETRQVCLKAGRSTAECAQLEMPR